jgi:hypothetical protein
MSDAPELACFYKPKLHSFGTSSKNAEWDFIGTRIVGMPTFSALQGDYDYYAGKDEEGSRGVLIRLQFAFREIKPPNLRSVVGTNVLMY